MYLMMLCVGLLVLRARNYFDVCRLDWEVEMYAVRDPSEVFDTDGDPAAWLSFRYLVAIRSWAILSRWRLRSRGVAW